MAKRRGLTPEDRALWSQVTRGATPLHPQMRQALHDGPPPAAHQPAQPGSQPHPQPPLPAGLAAFRIGEAARQAATQPQNTSQTPSPAQRLSAQQLRMDHKTHRRMTQGKLRPEARLDLHGMTLAQAQPELVDFILSCRATGLRLVLVITGKGRGDHGPLPTRPGALRHQVPVWLHHPPLSAAVQQVTAAHYRHGGEGAYYVYLRR